MIEGNEIDYTGALTAAKNGDEEAYEMLYNATVKQSRAFCMKLFDPATSAGRRKTDGVVLDTYLRVHERLSNLSDPADFPILCRSVAKECCIKKVLNENVQLETERYIHLAGGMAEEHNLVTADEIRDKVRGKAMPHAETVGPIVFATLHGMTPMERLAIVAWNEGDSNVMNYPETLRSAFAHVENSIIALEPVVGVRYSDFTNSPLAFFNRVLDLYNRFYEASSKGWERAKEPAYALALTGGDPGAMYDSVSFHAIWEELRGQFYLSNTGKLDPLDAYLEKDETAPSRKATAKKKKSPGRKFLSSNLGRILMIVVLVVLVLLVVVATSSQHTSYAATPTFMQIADSIFEQLPQFNIS